MRIDLLSALELQLNGDSSDEDVGEVGLGWLDT